MMQEKQKGKQNLDLLLPQIKFQFSFSHLKQDWKWISVLTASMRVFAVREVAKLFADAKVKVKEQQQLIDF